MQIEISGIQIEIQRKPVKHLRLTVSAPDGHVRVSAPKHLSDETIVAFVRDKIDWIKKQQGKFEKPAKDTFDVLGRSYYLRVVTGGKKNALALTGEEAVLSLRQDTTASSKEKFVLEWYRALLKEQIERYLPKWEQITGLHCQSWQIKNMRTRWGTCNTRTRKIWLNLQLAKKPIECLEYVILHELVHLKVPNHGKDFVAMMDRYMPGWKGIKKRLNG